MLFVLFASAVFSFSSTVSIVNSISSSNLDQDTSTWFPRVEYFHPPKGYQPVKGFEPPNSQPPVRLSVNAKNAMQQQQQQNQQNQQHSSSQNSNNNYPWPPLPPHSYQSNIEPVQQSQSQPQSQQSQSWNGNSEWPTLPFIETETWRRTPQTEMAASNSNKNHGLCYLILYF